MLPIAPSTYYEAKAREANRARLPARAQRYRALREDIDRVWRANRRVNREQKVWRQLGREQIAAACCTVERPMRADGLHGVVRGRRVRTTIVWPNARGISSSAPSAPIVRISSGSPTSPTS